MDDDTEYELREARSEIGRHHKLIVDLRDGLQWALELLQSHAGPRELHADDKARVDALWRLLDRQVG